MIFITLVGIAIAVCAIYSQRESPVPPMSTPEIVKEIPKPISLADIRVTVIRFGTDVTLLLDWERKNNSLPFHIWIEVDGSNVVLHSPGNEPRTIEVVPDETLAFYGSTLYHELKDNRLAIDLQVQKSED